MRAEIPLNANAPTARFAQAIKHKITWEVRLKARHVLGNNRDSLKSFLLHGPKTLRPISVSILTALAEISYFKIWSTDVKCAYLQAEDQLQRKIYIGQPAIEFHLEEDASVVFAAETVF